MPIGPVLAEAITATAVPPYALFQGGMDVLKQAGMSGNGYGTPIETIAVSEVGPNGVSSMSYTVEDPSGSVPIPASGTEIQFWDITSAHPEFRGWIQSVAVRPYPPLGRYLDIICIGIEAMLDWELTSGTFAAPGFSVTDAWQSLAQYTDIRDAVAAGGSEGTQSAPIAGTLSTRGFFTTLTVTNQTLREAIAAAWAACTQNTTDGTLNVTIDFYNGLRIWHSGTTGLRPDDYIQLTILDTTAGTFAGENVSYDLVYGEIVRAVRVIGSSDFGVFSDGTGKPGPTVLISDSNITTSTQAQQIATSYMNDRVAGVRGSLVLTDFDEGATAVRAGSNILLTDNQLGLSLTQFQIGQIDKTYDGNGRENWTITFGGPLPSASRAFRRLTRSVLS